MPHLQQFYVDPRNIKDDILFLEGEEFIHAARVLRKRKSDKLTAVDGQGHRFEGRVTKIEASRLVVQIEKKQKNAGEPRLQITLAHAVPKGSSFDWVVEKGTEMGVSAFQPISTERSIVDSFGRISRWQQKALAAMKQCGRCRCPKILHPLSFAESLKNLSLKCSFIAHESFENTQKVDLQSSLSSCQYVVVFIGPEGGFSEEEFEMAVKHGVQPISLGIRRLRSETAAIVAVTKLMDVAGDLGY